MATLVIAHSHVQLHYNTQAEKQGMVARLQAQQNVGRCIRMVKMYSKSAHVNDLGFAWTGLPYTSRAALVHERFAMCVTTRRLAILVVSNRMGGQTC